MNKAGQVLLQAVLVPSGIALRSEKDGALIVVHAVNLPAEFLHEMHADFGTYQAGRAGNKVFFHGRNQYLKITTPTEHNE